MTANDSWRDGVREPDRLAAVARSGLLGTGPEDAFDRLTELAATVTGATRACITFVDADNYVYKSTVGVPEGESQTGLIEESFCRYVVGSNRPFVVEDARNDPRANDNPAIELHGVAAWAGYPIQDASGWVLGTFCLISTAPYRWSDTDLHVLATLAAVASSEIALRRTRSIIASARSTTDQLTAAAEAELMRIAAKRISHETAAILQQTIQLAQQVSDTLNPTQAPENLQRTAPNRDAVADGPSDAQVGGRPSA